MSTSPSSDVYLIPPIVYFKITTTNRYMGSPVGTEVSMDDINTMWVWIPRYEYMYTNLGTAYAGGTKEQPGEIKVNFVTGSTVAVSDSANYKMHPAFTFGEDEVEGIWYAKFETGGTLPSDGQYCTNIGCNVSTITVKPGIASLRSQTISSFFYMARSMQLNNASTFGFSATDSDLHMCKNSEWGSVAYLSQSKYGKYGNSDYSISEKEITINVNTNFITGNGENLYSNSLSSSTTGNITGIYDASGGTYEYVMGVMADNNGLPMSGGDLTYNSGFDGSLSNGIKQDGVAFPDRKYYDLYISSNPNSDSGTISATSCNNGVCFGHALSESLGYYNDSSNFIFITCPWLIRGGYYDSGNTAGIFAFYYSSGLAAANGATRLTHIPLK